VSRTNPQRGYMLLETIVAMMVLSVGVLAVNRALYQVLLTRAIARDYTEARFLLEQVIAPIELQPLVAEGEAAGDFGEAYPRFSWRRTIERVPVPIPDLPTDLPDQLRGLLEESAGHLGEVTVTVEWTRAGRSYQRTAMTMVAPHRIWSLESQEPSDE